jgi:hypothetical protein
MGDKIERFKTEIRTAGEIIIGVTTNQPHRYTIIKFQLKNRLQSRKQPPPPSTRDSSLDMPVVHIYATFSNKGGRDKMPLPLLPIALSNEARCSL